MAVHNAGKGAKYTKGRLPVRLVWYREWNNGHDARSCEFYLKRKQNRRKKHWRLLLERIQIERISEKTKYLTEAAAAAAIASLLVLLKLLAPFFVFVTMIASPIPIAVIAIFTG